MPSLYLYVDITDGKAKSEVSQMEFGIFETKRIIRNGEV